MKGKSKGRLVEFELSLQVLGLIVIAFSGKSDEGLWGHVPPLDVFVFNKKYT